MPPANPHPAHDDWLDEPVIPGVQPALAGGGLFANNPWGIVYAGQPAPTPAAQYIEKILGKKAQVVAPQTEEEKQLPLSKLFTFNGLTVEKAKHLAYEQTQPAPKYKMVNETALLGIEVEVENITGPVNVTHYWTSTNDGSLRNYGVEFTTIPMRAKQVEHAIRHLDKALREFNNPDFSIRTSCHVHLNVRDMTWDQIKTLVLLYSIFERHFFNIAGTKREESIFCVPIYKTEALRDLDLFHVRYNRWHKYCALNLLPIIGKDDTKRYGTVEFRHLYGTSDVETIINWCNQILCLRQATQKYNYEDLKKKVRELNTTSEYIAMYKDIFGEYADLKKMSKFDFEYCITQAKKELFGKEYQDKLAPTKKSAAYQMMIKLGVL